MTKLVCYKFRSLAHKYFNCLISIIDMKNIKRIIFSLIAFTISIAWICTSEDINFPYNGWIWNWWNWSSIDLNFWPTLKNSISYTANGEQTNWLSKILEIFMPRNILYLEWWNPSILFYLKTIVNMLLSFVSLIALILMIYAFYMIFFKKDDAGISTARQMIKWIVIWLAVIGFSRIVVSFLFRFEWTSTDLTLNLIPTITNII